MVFGYPPFPKHRQTMVYPDLEIIPDDPEWSFPGMVYYWIYHSLPFFVDNPSCYTLKTSMTIASAGNVMTQILGFKLSRATPLHGPSMAMFKCGFVWSKRISLHSISCRRRVSPHWQSHPAIWCHPGSKGEGWWTLCWVLCTSRAGNAASSTPRCSTEAERA